MNHEQRIAIRFMSRHAGMRLDVLKQLRVRGTSIPEMIKITTGNVSSVSSTFSKLAELGFISKPVKRGGAWTITDLGLEALHCIEQGVLPLEPVATPVPPEVRLRPMSADVRLMMQAGGQEPSPPTANLYRKLIGEEFSELIEGWLAGDEVAEFDACLDLIWVVTGYMLAKGWPVNQGWAEVARSNHEKIVDGRLLKREDGKVLKPPQCTPPDLAGVLAAWRAREAQA